jgi:hypothetical protein
MNELRSGVVTKGMHTRVHAHIHNNRTGFEVRKTQSLQTAVMG